MPPVVGGPDVWQEMRQEQESHTSGQAKAGTAASGGSEPSALALEESLEDLAALVGHQAADNLGPVVGSRASEQVVH